MPKIDDDCAEALGCGIMIMCAFITAMILAYLNKNSI